MAVPMASVMATIPEVDGFANPQQLSVEPGILRMPVELILRMFEVSDLRSALNLARTNKTFKMVWDGHREHIIMSVLRAELSPFDDLLQLVVSEPNDIYIPLGPCLRRKIYHMGRSCSKGETLLGPDEWAHVLPPRVTMTGEHFDRLLNLYKVIKGWEQLFPRHRFEKASDRRELHPHESERLRAALYRWMSYAQYFHGDLPRPNRFIPQKYSTDIRCKRFRLLSDTELHEFHDLWETVQKIVRCEICPSTEAVMKNMNWRISREEAERIGFGSSKPGLTRAVFSWIGSTFVRFDSNVHYSIVNTVLKLPPGEILHLAANRCGYTREALAREVLRASPHILSDQQSLGHALSAVMEERQDGRVGLLEPLDTFYPPLDSPGLRTGSNGGILDLIVEDAEVRAFWGGPHERALGWDPLEKPELEQLVVMNEGQLEP